MVVRLAYERGYLTTKNPNKIQRWGLIYYIYMDRRQNNEDVRQIQELQTFELFPQRWMELHGMAKDEEMVGGEAYAGVADPREVDEFLARYGNELERPRELSGADVEYYGLEV